MKWLPALVVAQGVMVLPPPEKYRYEFLGQTIMYELPLSQAREMCKRRGLTADACSWVKDRKCFIVYPKGKGALDSPVAYYWHEMAHCNSWPAYHPGN